MTHVLLCATEAGGSRNLAPVAARAHAQGLDAVVFTRSHCAYLWEPVPPLVLDASDADVAREFDRRRPDVVICGTTAYRDLEVTVIAEAHRRGIPSLAIVDERYGYTARFSLGGRLQFPTAIGLMDARAVEEAIAEGVPAGICHATGSPGLAAIAATRDRFAAHPPACPVPSTRPIVTFVSETVAACYGTSAATPGPLGPFLGYTEDSVRADLLAAFGEMGADVVLVEKVHPAAESIPAVVEGGPVPHLVVRSADLPALLWHSRLVIGMRSMAVLEAALLGAPALSYQPGLRVPQRCTAVLLGAAPCVTTKGELIAWCRATLAAPPGARLPVPSSARADAAGRVFDLARAVAVGRTVAAGA
jgi:hypothetical protein